MGWKLRLRRVEQRAFLTLAGARQHDRGPIQPLCRRAALGDAEAYRYLPASTAYLPEPDEMLAMLRRAGFTDLARRTMMLGAVQLITGSRA